MIDEWPDSTPTARQVNKNDASLSKHELAKKKTEEALKKKRDALKANKGKPSVEGPAAAGGLGFRA